MEATVSFWAWGSRFASANGWTGSDQLDPKPKTLAGLHPQNGPHKVTSTTRLGKPGNYCLRGGLQDGLGKKKIPSTSG